MDGAARRRNRFTPGDWIPLSGNQCQASGPPRAGPTDSSHFKFGMCNRDSLQAATSVSSTVTLNKTPRGPKGGIEELGEKGLRPHKPGLGTRQGPHKRPSSEEGGLASCSFCASGKSYVSAKSQESESWSRTLQSVS